MTVRTLPTPRSTTCRQPAKALRLLAAVGLALPMVGSCANKSANDVIVARDRHVTHFSQTFSGPLPIGEIVAVRLLSGWRDTTDGSVRLRRASFVGLTPNAKYAGVWAVDFRDARLGQVLAVMPGRQYLPPKRELLPISQYRFNDSSMDLIVAIRRIAPGPLSSHALRLDYTVHGRRGTSTINFGIEVTSR